MHDSNRYVQESKTSSQHNVDNSSEDEEHIINWKEEAIAIINDVKLHVADIHLSEILPNSNSNIYLNIRTLEGDAYCVHVSNGGFRIVSQLFDVIDDNNKIITDDNNVYETPHSLLNTVSPRYVESFGNKLCKELLNLQQTKSEDEIDDNSA